MIVYTRSPVIRFSVCSLPGRYYGKHWDKVSKYNLDKKGKYLTLESIEVINSEELPMDFWRKDTFHDITREEVRLLLKGFYGSPEVEGIVLEFYNSIYDDEYITTFRAYNPNKYSYYIDLIGKDFDVQYNPHISKLKGLTKDDLDFLSTFQQKT